MRNQKVIAHVPEEDGWLSEQFFILARVDTRGFMWFCVEPKMINRFDNVIFETVEEAKQWLRQEYSNYDKPVVFEPFDHVEVY